LEKARMADERRIGRVDGDLREQGLALQAGETLRMVPQAPAAGVPAVGESAARVRRASERGLQASRALPESAEVAGIVAAQRKSAARSGSTPSPSPVKGAKVASLRELAKSLDGYEASMDVRAVAASLAALWERAFGREQRSAMQKKIGEDVERKLVRLCVDEWPLLDKQTAALVSQTTSALLLDKDADSARLALKQLRNDHWDGNAWWITAISRLVDTYLNALAP